MHVLNCPGICKKLELRGVSEIKCEFLQKSKDRKIILLRFFNIDVADSNILLVSLELILVSAGEVDHDDLVSPYYLSLSKRYFGNPHDFRFPKSSKPFRSLSLCIENSWKCRMFFFRLKFSQNFRSKT